MLKKLSIIFMSLLLFLSYTPIMQGTIFAEEVTLDEDVELWNTLVPLKSTVSFVNVGAHPDDERSDLLAYLSRGIGVDASSLIANRGEGGQNQIGTELSTPLGIIRSLEMQEAAIINGVDAHHLSSELDDSIFDFGFSKSPEETLEKWGEETTKERLVKYIRTKRPDIIMPTFRDVPSQHGHHRAMSQLAVEVFDLAADENAFPEHFEAGLDPWQAKKLYLPPESDELADFSIEIGDYDEVYEMTYPQLGEESRYLHKSQGMGQDIPAEPRKAYFEVKNEKNLIETNNDNEILNGIPADFGEWAEAVEDDEDLNEDLNKLHEQINSTIESYPSFDDVFIESIEALKIVEEVQANIENATIDQEMKNDLNQKLSEKKAQLIEANFIASKIKVTPESDHHVLVKNQENKVNVNIEHQGSESITDLQIALQSPEDWATSDEETINLLESNDIENINFDVKVPENATYFHPYRDPVLSVNVSYEYDGVKISENVDLDETIAVLPEISLSLSPEEMIVNSEEIQEHEKVNVKVKNYVNGEANTTVNLDVPEGWDYEPKDVQVDFSEKHEEQDVEFTVSIPEDVEDGTFEIQAIADYEGSQLTDTIQEIQYDHIGKSYYQYPAKVKGNVFELNRVKGLKIGYINSGFDEVDDYLRNAGFDVTTLSEGMLDSEDLSQFDTIVTGIRAYMAREDLVERNDNLLEYVEDGGHLVIQHNLPAEFDSADPSPYPLTVGRPSIEWRVTDENSDVEILNPDSELLHFPNEIVESDWENWVQERGLYFPMEWSDEYETLVRMGDPGEEPFDGSVLYAEYGEGTYLYTSLGFYRQIQNEVAGGYRIFTNFLSYGQSDNDKEELNEIIKVSQLEDITVAYGTSFKDLPLPNEVTGELADGSAIDLNIEWAEEGQDYNSKKPGKYVLVGQLDIPEGYKTDESLEVPLTVQVAEEKDTGVNNDDNTENVEQNDNTNGETNENESDNNNNQQGAIDNENDKSLPKTATNIYTWLTVGLALLVIGLILFYVRRRKA